MMVKTKHFGEMYIDENGIIDFPEGIPGFDELKKYILLSPASEASPFKWLQSVEDSTVSFAVADPFYIKSDYEVNLDDNVLKTLMIEDQKDVLVLSIVLVPSDASKASINFKAPVIINLNKKKAMQVILDTDTYGVRHYIAQELREQEAKTNACVDTQEGPINNTK